MFYKHLTTKEGALSGALSAGRIFSICNWMDVVRKTEILKKLPWKVTLQKRHKKEKQLLQQLILYIIALSKLVEVYSIFSNDF